MDFVWDSIGRLAEASDQAELAEIFSEAAAHLGFKNYCYFSRSRFDHTAEPLILTDYPVAWMQRYHECHYERVDPVVQRSLHSITPFYWPGKMPMRGLLKRLFEEAREYGIHTGLTVPIHGASGEFGAMTVVHAQPTMPPDGAGDEIQHCMHVLSLHFHSHTERLGTSGRNVSVQLTRRELECLSWTGQGKTAWEISTILDISENTVVYYLESAKRKLGVYNKNHAVLRAAMLGLVII